MSDPRDVTYAGYLDLDVLLSAQKPHSDQHDEMLFVVIHQTKELWLKQMLHELALAQRLVRAGDLVPAYKSLARISRIQAVMTQSWDVLATMTPADYLNFRAVLGSSSGFQSDQFRRFEAMLGLKNPAFLRHHVERPHAHAALKAAIEAPSLYDDTLVRLAAAGLDVPDDVLSREVSTPYAPSPAVEEAWLDVYRRPHEFWELYQLAEKLVDLDDALLTWRHKHVVTVERIIGRRMGTGGTAGVGYLTETLSRRCFPELWSIRTRL
ncbi:MAG: tryptophan 2,3-dioxygenase [Caulobacteraceae bacterium]|nr:tryptophan 2,3-dioxygenase [Caulobacteraceae bacterium]